MEKQNKKSKSLTNKVKEYSIHVMLSLVVILIAWNIRTDLQTQEYIKYKQPFRDSLQDISIRQIAAKQNEYLDYTKKCDRNIHSRINNYSDNFINIDKTLSSVKLNQRLIIKKIDEANNNTEIRDLIKELGGYYGGSYSYTGIKNESLIFKNLALDNKKDIKPIFMSKRNWRQDNFLINDVSEIALPIINNNK